MLALGASLLTLLSVGSAGGGSTFAKGTPGLQAAPHSLAQASPSEPTSGSTPSTSSGVGAPTVKIGSDDFYEAKIVAEIYAQALEAHGFTVDRTAIGMGARAVSAPALVSGQIDLKPEYVGSGLRNASVYTGGAGASPEASAAASPAESAAPVDATDPDAELQALQQALSGVGITALNISPAADQNGFVVRPETAQQFNLAKMSDTAAVQDQIKWGLATDCPTNPLCGAPGGALESDYGITQQTLAGATLLAACDQPMVDALTNKTIDLGELCTTQPDIAQNGWVLLQDDKNSQPADNLVPLVRNDYLAQVDSAAFEQILNDVSAKLTTDGLLQLNKQFVFDKADIAVIAKGWLQQNGFVQ
jgi:osmoprotectant transport system substrate-binding protein